MKKNLLIIFGGCSSEYEVSLRSAASVLRNAPREKYEVKTVGITKDGKWLYYTGDIDSIENNCWNTAEFTSPCVLSPDKGSGVLIVFTENGICNEVVDVVFPVMHGKNGEDGTIQGLFELCGLPYVGCGVLSSAMCMDKAITNTICDYNGILQAKWALVTAFEFSAGTVDYDSIAAKLGYPIFVKPANAGSSVGISKAADITQLKAALELAFEHDSRAVLEQTVIGRELECAVMGNEEPIAACVGEVVPCNDFYDYAAKYIDGDSELLIPAPISAEKSEEICATAIRVYSAMCCAGLSRVDFFLTENGDIYLNELNTIPGFTSISMYSKLFEEAGVPYGELVDKLVQYALRR